MKLNPDLYEDISKYDMSSVKRMTTAGEALNPEVYYQFEKLTGLLEDDEDVTNVYTTMAPAAE